LLDNFAIIWAPAGGAYSLRLGGMPTVRYVNTVRNDLLAAMPEDFALRQMTRRGTAIVRHGDDVYYNIPAQAGAREYGALFSRLREIDRYGDQFTDAAQQIRNSYSYERLSPTWRDRIESAGERWLGLKWESAARGSYIHERFAERLELGLIRGAEDYTYRRTGIDLVPKNGVGLKYEITQWTPSLNAISTHSRRYTSELFRFVTYR
jgi:hypothetical protein